MAHPITAPYGSWSSPITPEVLTQGTPTRDLPQQQGNTLYWQESRPDQNGRITIMTCHLDSSGNPINERELLPYPMSARSKVNEYGGKSWAIDKHSLYFVLQDDQRIYQLPLNQPNATPIALTPDDAAFRHADLIVDPTRPRLVCVREDYSSDAHEPVCAIVAIGTDHPDEPVVLVDGEDFYAYPRFSADGQNLCWISWNHPNMPWDGTKLYTARLTDNGFMKDIQKVAGGKDESIFQPGWSPTGELYFVSDKSGWWNLYSLRHGEIRHLVTMPAEFGLPLWSLGMSTYSFVNENYLVALYTSEGFWHLGLVDTDSGVIEAIPTPYKALSSIQGETEAGSAVLIGASETTAGDVVKIDTLSKSLTVIKKSEPSRLQGYLSSPHPLSFPTSDGDTAHGFYYPPHNQRYKGSSEEKPPLIVMCHGGPTGACSPALNLKIQYWTSRGFALLDVNYRGSTGYGREYREKLTNRWGIADVNDVAAGARHLARLGYIDPMRTLIRGSSAGGYTVLAALTFTDQFRAGASLYGIGNLESLAKDTHKFESRYLEKLVGPYPAERQRYLDRSPASHSQQLNCPIIFLQGLEDRVVPPNQAEEMVNALEKKGLPVAYITFRGEGHGFRKAANIKAAMEAELYFFRTILGISSVETLPRIAIKNRK